MPDDTYDLPKYRKKLFQRLHKSLTRCNLKFLLHYIILVYSICLLPLLQLSLFSSSRFEFFMESSPWGKCVFGILSHMQLTLYFPQSSIFLQIASQLFDVASTIACTTYGNSAKRNILKYNKFQHMARVKNVLFYCTIILNKLSITNEGISENYYK